jgi:hypothetical protein
MGGGIESHPEMAEEVVGEAYDEASMVEASNGDFKIFMSDCGSCKQCLYVLAPGHVLVS